MLPEYEVRLANPGRERTLMTHRGVSPGEATPISEHHKPIDILIITGYRCGEWDVRPCICLSDRAQHALPAVQAPIVLATVSVWSAHIDLPMFDSRKKKVEVTYISSKRLVCRWYLSLGFVQSRTISSMVLPVLMLFGRSSKTHLSARLSTNESAYFESVQRVREAFTALLILASIQPPFSFSPCNVNRRTPLRRALGISADSSCGSHVPRSQSMMGPVSCMPSNSRFALL